MADGLIPRQTFGSGELAVDLENDVRVQDSVIVSEFTLTGRFRWSQTTVNEELANGSVFTASTTFRINVSRFNQSEKFKAPSSLLSPDDGIGTNEDASDELRAVFPELEKLPFDFPKPTSLVAFLVHAVCRSDQDAIVMDSFAGTGTTGHAVLGLNRSDGGVRRFILVEMEEAICQNVTAQRLTRAIQGHNDLPALGSGFRYCRLGPPIFDEVGSIRAGVTFNELAAHVYFTETGEPIPKRADGKTPLLGVHNGKAVYLLFNGILGDRSAGGGNVLTNAVLRALPAHDGPRIVYGEGSRLGAARLKREGIVFKQIPYGIKTT